MSSVVVSVNWPPAPPFNTIPLVITLPEPMSTASFVFTTSTGPVSRPVSSSACPNTTSDACSTVNVPNRTVSPESSLNNTRPVPPSITKSFVSPAWLSTDASFVNSTSPAPPPVSNRTSV